MKQLKQTSTKEHKAPQPSPNVVAQSAGNTSTVHPNPPLFTERYLGNSATQSRQVNVQAKKHSVGAADDAYEREAEQVAGQIMESSAVSRQHTPTPLIQRRTAESAGGVNVETAVDLQQGGGQALSPTTRQFMEPRFDADFGHVRLHADPQAHQLAAQIQARAFTYGNHIWLGEGASEQDKPLIAHELTHVLQQTALPVGQIQRAVLGDFRYSYDYDKGKVTVHSRTVRQWETFLRNDADEENGNIELNAFMAAALGHDRALSGIGMTQSFIGQRPSPDDAINLMVAFLSVGENIDLPDYWVEGFTKAQFGTANLMSEFNARFAADAIVRMTSQSNEFNTDEFNAIKAYAGEAVSQSDQTPHFIRQNPVHTLVASALGTAVGATASLNTYNSEPPASSPENAKIQRAFNLITNGGRVIKATVEQAEEDQNTKKTILMTVFNTAVAGVGVALSAATGPGAAIVTNAISVMSPMAESFLDAALNGNATDQLRHMVDRYNDEVDGLTSARQPLLANFAANAKDAFKRGLDF